MGWWILVTNITNLVCYTNFHWFFKHECQHIFGKQTRYIFQSPKNDNMDDKKITRHWINSIKRNNKCIFTKLNAVFKLKTAVWTNKILQQIIPSQIPGRFSKLLCSTAVPLHEEHHNTKCWALKTFDVIGPHQGFVYMLLIFKLSKLFRKPVVLLYL